MTQGLAALGTYAGGAFLSYIFYLAWLIRKAGLGAKDPNNGGDYPPAGGVAALWPVAVPVLLTCYGIFWLQRRARKQGGRPGLLFRVAHRIAFSPAQEAEWRLKGPPS